MALPSSRNTTYAPGSQIKSEDLNAIQDEIVELDDDVRGEQPPLWIHGSDFSPALPDTNDVAVNDAGTQATGAETHLYAGVPLPVGAEVLSIDFYITAGNTDGTRHGALSRSDLPGVSPSWLGSSSTKNDTYSIAIADLPHVLQDKPYVLAAIIKNLDYLHGARIVWRRKPGDPES